MGARQLASKSRFRSPRFTPPGHLGTISVSTIYTGVRTINGRTVNEGTINGGIINEGITGSKGSVRFSLKSGHRTLRVPV